MASAPKSSPAGTTHLDESISDGDRGGMVGETLRRARQHRGWSLREVARRLDRPNAYLSQVERGIIRQPDPAVVWQLAQLYELDFTLLAEWLGLGDQGHNDAESDVTGRLIRLVLSLTAEQKLRALGAIQQLSHDERT